METLRTLKTAIRRANYGVSFVAMFALVPLMLLTSAEVVGRAVWSRPIPGTLELSSYLLAIFVLLGVAYTQQAKGHVRAEMFTSRLSPRVGAAVDVLTVLLSLTIVAVVAWQGFAVGAEERAVSDMLRVPQRPFKLLVGVAGTMLFLELLVDLGDALGRLVRR